MIYKVLQDLQDTKESIEYEFKEWSGFQKFFFSLTAKFSVSEALVIKKKTFNFIRPISNSDFSYENYRRVKLQ